MDPNPAVAALLREAMALGNFTQKSLGYALDVDQSTINRWVNGKAMPPTEKWAELETTLKLPEHAIAQLAGHIVLVDESIEALPPLVVKAAHNLNDLDPKDRDHVIELIDRLLRD